MIPLRCSFLFVVPVDEHDDYEHSDALYRVQLLVQNQHQSQMTSAQASRAASIHEAEGTPSTAASFAESETGKMKTTLDTQISAGGPTSRPGSANRSPWLTRCSAAARSPSWTGRLPVSTLQPTPIFKPLSGRSLTIRCYSPWHIAFELVCYLCIHLTALLTTFLKSSHRL